MNDSIGQLCGESSNALILHFYDAPTPFSSIEEKPAHLKLLEEHGIKAVTPRSSHIPNATPETHCIFGRNDLSFGRGHWGLPCHMRSKVYFVYYF